MSNLIIDLALVFSCLALALGLVCWAAQHHPDE